MAKVPALIKQGFVHGDKTSFDPGTVPDDSLWESLNVRADLSGILRIRPGSNRFNATALGTGPFQSSLYAFGGIASVWNRNLYKFNSSGVPTQITTNNAMASNATTMVEMIHWTHSSAEIAYILTGSGGIYQTDGTTASLTVPYVPASGEQPNLINNAGVQNITSGPAGCTFGILRASLSQRMALSGNPQTPNAIYLSAPLDGTYFPGNQIIQLPDDGDSIVAIANFYEYLAIFRNRDIWMFKGSDLTDSAAELTMQEANVGCIARRSVAYVPDVGLVFLGYDNVYALEGYYGYGYVSRAKATPIGDDVRKYLQTAISETTDFTQVSGVYYNREYRMVFPNIAQDEAVFRFNLQNQAGWYMDTGPITNQFIVYNQQLYASSNQDGLIYHFTNSLTDDGSAIPFYVSFKRENLQPGPARIKRIFIYAMSKGRVGSTTTNYFGNTFNAMRYNQEDVETANVSIGSEQDLEINLIVDGMSFGTVDYSVHVDKVSFLSLQQVEPVRIYEVKFHPSLKANFLQIQINANTSGQDIAVIGYAVDYSTRGRIHGTSQGVTL